MKATWLLSALSIRVCLSPLVRVRRCRRDCGATSPAVAAALLRQSPETLCLIGRRWVPRARLSWRSTGCLGPWSADVGGGGARVTGPSSMWALNTTSPRHGAQLLPSSGVNGFIVVRRTCNWVRVVKACQQRQACQECIVNEGQANFLRTYLNDPVDENSLDRSLQRGPRILHAGEHIVVAVHRNRGGGWHQHS